MGENEIKDMINYNKGEQWNYMVEDIKYIDTFTLTKGKNYKQFVLDRRIANYIIEKWKESNVKEIQELITVYKSLM